MTVISMIEVAKEDKFNGKNCKQSDAKEPGRKNQLVANPGEKANKRAAMRMKMSC